MPPILIIAGLALAIVAAVVFWRRAKLNRRQRSLTRLLDLADLLEKLLDRSRERMQALQAVVGRVPADIGAVAQASLESDLPFQDAKRDLLGHRLWIQRHGETATQAELDTALAALQRAHDRLQLELQQLDQAGSELAELTAADAEAARREPPNLRRKG